MECAALGAKITNMHVSPVAVSRNVAAGIRPGDRVNVRVRPEGGVIIEAVAALKSEQLYNGRLEEMSRRRPIRGLSTEDVMRMTRGED